MSIPLWMSIEPVRSEVRLMLTAPAQGTVLKARLPNPPQHPRAVIALLEAISFWYRQPLHAVVDADAEDVRRDPERWALLLGDAPELAVSVEWAAVPAARRKDPFLASMGDFAAARRLVSFAATGAAMITPEMRAEMRRLVIREGWKYETVARRFGVHHSVVRRAVAGETEGGAGGAPPIPSVLEPFKPYIVERLTDYPSLTATRLLLELRDRGYAHSLTIIRRYVAKVRAPRAKKAYLRVETEPGEVAQVDWGSFGHMRIGNTQRPLSAFAIVLKWSRVLYVDFSLDQRMDTFLRMHERAFAALGGIPKKVIYDNLKSVVLHHVGTTVQFNPAFLAFAGHMLFEPVAAPVRYPQAKGNVENAIKYIRTSFFYGRSFRGIEDVRDQAAQWLREVANQRVHATTRERPADRHLIEKTRLRALPEHPFDTDLVVPMIVSKESRVHLDTNTYSVPHSVGDRSIVGRSVHLRADDRTVRVVLDRVVIAEHARCWDRHRAIELPAHIDALLERRPSARGPRRRDRLAALSPGAAMYLKEVARRRIHLETEVRKLLRLLDLYGEAEVERGMVAALTQRTFGARYVHTLIDQARFANGVAEPPDPVVTGNAAADNADVTPHDLEKYDALF